MRNDLIYLVELGYYDTAAKERTAYFGSDIYITTPHEVPANTSYLPRIVSPLNYERNLFRSGKTGGASQGGWGQLELINTDGSLDYLLGQAFDGRSLRILTIYPDQPRASAVLLMQCTIAYVEFSMSKVTVNIRDDQQLFAQPIQAHKFLGSNADKYGIEGTDTIKDRAKPITYGYVYNMAPTAVNSASLLYMVHDGAIVDVPAVYDRGVALAKGGDYATVAALVDAALVAGSYGTCKAAGVVRLASSPAGQVTADVVGECGANPTAGQIVQRIAQERAGLEYGHTIR